MVWNDPMEPSWDVGDALTSADVKKYLRDNLLALKEPPTDSYVLDETADYTTTNTQFVDIDSDELALQIHTKEGDVMVHFHGTVNISGSVYFDILVDESREGGDDGIVRYTNNTTQPQVVSFTRLITGLAEGVHDFVLQWKVASGTATLYAGAGTNNLDVHPQFWVREVS